MRSANGKDDLYTRRLNLYLPALLAVAVVCAFWPLSQAGFVSIDDPVYLSPQVRQGLTWEGLRWAFATTHAEFYHPLTWLSLMLDAEIHGPNPGGFHLTNLLLHLLNTLFLYAALVRMTGRAGRSAFAAALFALHPLHVEPVAWVASRKDLLSTLFWMLTLWAYAAYVQRPGWARYGAVTGCLLLGLLAKPMLVTLPFVLLLLDGWPLNRFQAQAGEGSRLESFLPAARRLVLEKLPWIALALAAAAVAYYAQQVRGGIVPAEIFPLEMRVKNAVLSYALYLAKTLWPANLAVFYPFPDDFPWWRLASASALLIGLSLAAVLWRHRRPYFPVGWLWYLGTLVPVIGLVKVGEFGMADRYTYVPLIGIFVIMSWGGAELAGNGRMGKALAGAAAGAALIVLGAMTWQQCRVWRSSATLYAHALQVTTDNHLMHFSMGQVLAARGDIDRAVEHYRKAVDIRPGNAVLQYFLGKALAAQGKYEAAARHLSEAVRIHPDYPKAIDELVRVREKIEIEKSRRWAIGNGP